MPITFPGDSPFGEPSRQYTGAQGVGGVEKYGAVDGSTINVTNLNASAITAGTIDASVLSVTNINANNITAGNLAAARMQTNVLSAVQATISTLSAIKADLGTITAGTINGVTINGSTINGGLSGGAVNIYGNNLNLKDSGGTTRINIWHSGGSSSWDQPTGTLNMQPALNANGGVTVSGCFTASPSNKWGALNNIDMNDFNIDDCTDIWAFNFNSRSDRRLKRNISSYAGSLKKVMALNPVGFVFKKDKTAQKHIGLIAQEVKPVLPELVKKDEAGLLSISYNELIPVLIGAIQELKTEVDTLKKSK